MLNRNAFPLQASLVVLTGGMVALVAAAASAATLTPTGVTFSSEFSGRNALDTINSSGLTGGAHDVVPENMWMSTSADAGAGTATITWDLGNEYLLTGFHMWNYNEASGGLSTRGIMSGTIRVAQDAAFTTGVQTFANQFFTQAPSAAGYLGENYALSAFGRYVQFTDLDHFPYPIAQGDQSPYVGISEIRFLGDFPPPAPEPATGLLLGLGLIALRSARRKSRSVT